MGTSVWPVAPQPHEPPALPVLPAPLVPVPSLVEVVVEGSVSPLEPDELLVVDVLVALALEDTEEFDVLLSLSSTTTQAEAKRPQSAQRATFLSMVLGSP
jgi:hypothetical protein